VLKGNGPPIPTHPGLFMRFEQADVIHGCTTALSRAWADRPARRLVVLPLTYFVSGGLNVSLTGFVWPNSHLNKITFNPVERK